MVSEQDIAQATLQVLLLKNEDLTQKLHSYHIIYTYQSILSVPRGGFIFAAPAQTKVLHQSWWLVASMSCVLQQAVNAAVVLSGFSSSRIFVLLCG